MKIPDQLILDAKALQVYVWLLNNQTDGQVRTSRHKLATLFSFDPSAVQQVLKRLRNKYGLIKWSTSMPASREGTVIFLETQDKLNWLPDASIKSSINKKEKKEKESNKEKEIKERNKEVLGENENLKTLLTMWNTTFGTNFKALSPLEENFKHWANIYTLEEMITAVKMVPQDAYWKDKMTPVIFLRRMNPNREAVDNIGKFLNMKSTPKEYLSLEEATEKGLAW